MRRRDFTFCVLLSAGARMVRAQEPTKQHRMAVIFSGPVADIRDTGSRYWPAFFEELRRLGDVEGQNFTIDRYSGEGRPEDLAKLAREVVNRNPDLIIATTNPIALAVRVASCSIAIVWIGSEPVRFGLATSLAHPGGNITGVTADAGYEIFGKQLQILKEAVPSVSKVAYLTITTVYGERFRQLLQEISRRLGISLTAMAVEESTPSEYRRAFAEISQEPPDAIVVSSIGNLLPHRRLIVELIKKSRLPAIYPWRDYVEVGGLMAYESDFAELGRRMADDVHQILNGAKPGDIPIYQATKFQFIINLRAAEALGLTIPPSLLARADEVIE